MESMKENKALLYSLVSTGSFIFLLACGVIPELSQQFGIVDFPPEVNVKFNHFWAGSKRRNDLFQNAEIIQIGD